LGSVASENTIERRLADHIVRHRCLWFMAVVVTVGLLGVGVSMLNVKSDYRDFVDPKDPYRQALEMMAERYSEVGDVAVVLLRPRSEDIFQPRVLAATGWVTEEIAKLAYVTRVQSVTQLLRSRRAEDTASVVSTSSAAASLRAGDLSGFLVSRTGDAAEGHGVHQVVERCVQSTGCGGGTASRVIRQCDSGPLRGCHGAHLPKRS